MDTIFSHMGQREMIKFAVGFVFIALVLLIMRISDLNEEIALVKNEIRGHVTHRYIDDMVELSSKRCDGDDLRAGVREMKSNMADPNRGHV